MTNHEEIMQRVLALAEKGRGFTSPNPMVGAIIIKDGKVIGEGYHRAFGAEHAEVVALRQAGEDARDADLYVNLEPCCFYGKTPPCVEAIQRAGIKHVYTAMIDPNPLVNGKGVAQLRAAGIEVTIGIAEKQARELNRGFITYFEKKRPWITLKMALTADGFIADVSGRSRYLTGEESRRYVKQQRQRHDAVAVGLGTVFKDDPSLLPLNRAGFIPQRIVFDEQFNIPERMQLVTDDFRRRTLILTTNMGKRAKLQHFKGLGVSVIETEADDFGWLNLEKSFNKLRELGITSVYCEGGSQIAGSLLANHLVDELQLFIAPKILGEGLRSFSGIMKSFEEAIQLHWLEVMQIGTDIFIKGELLPCSPE